jgi:hypothetical protein
MWEEVEARIAENDRLEVVPFRREMLEEIKASNLRPAEARKKMIALESGSRDRIVWQIEGSACLTSAPKGHFRLI